MNDLVRKTEVINELVALTSYKTKLEITEVIEADLSRMDKWLGGVEDCLNAIEAIQPVDAVPVSYIYKRAMELKNDDMMYAYTVLNSLIANYRADGERKEQEQE